MKHKVWAAIALLTAAAWSLDAHATTGLFNLSGGGVSGALTITYQPSANTGPLGSVPNTVDPVGSYAITNVSGTFSDSNIGIANATITGVTALNRVNPEATNFLAPNSFSLFTVQNGVQGPSGPPSPGLHYDNLLYPAGSPQTASDYPFSGGMLDIYGLLFQLSNGDYVNVWSNGSFMGSPLDYGVAVVDPVNQRDYVGGVNLTAVPEPASWAMMVLGLGGLGAILRRRKTAALATA